MSTIITGHDAIAHAARTGAPLHKHADPVDGARGITLDEARRRVGDRVALQGNVDPVVLYAGIDAIRAEARKAVRSFGPHLGHVFNLGHGIHPAIDPEHLRALIEAVHEESAALFAQANGNTR